MGDDQLTRRELLAVLGSTAGAVALGQSLDSDGCSTYREPAYDPPTHSVTVSNHEYACDMLDAPVNTSVDESANGTADVYNVSTDDCCGDTDH